MQPWITRPSNTVSMYSPISSIRTAKLSTSASFPAMMEAIPTGEALKKEKVDEQARGRGSE